LTQAAPSPKGQKNQNRKDVAMQNRRRAKAVTLRMTEDECSYFHRQMKKTKHKNQTDFFLAVLHEKPIIIIEDLAQVLAELKRQGNNLNQVSRHLNEYGELSEPAKTVMNECWKSYRDLSNLAEVIVCRYLKALPAKVSPPK
jgi:hypothetical protein